MRRYLPVLALVLAWSGTAHADGLLVPEGKGAPVLAMLSHKVSIAIEEQVAVTRVEQTFRNASDQQLEATYVFPVPRGAAVDKFSVSVNGKELPGELIEAAKAREIYADLVRHTHNPGLLEYVGNNLLRVRVAPIPANSEQKISLSYTAVAPRQEGLVEYVYPLRTDGRSLAARDLFSITATIKSQHAIQNVYCPTHSVTTRRANDHEVTITFDRQQGVADKDFQIYYSIGDKDVGLTALAHRPAGDNGYFLLLMTPKLDFAKETPLPRDMVLVLDTSGSMHGAKIDQAKKALKYCLTNLDANDRFALLNFSTRVTKYKPGLLDVSQEAVADAGRWVDQLRANGLTAINDALLGALELRSDDPGRTFTVVFFTDGLPTVGERRWEKILKNVEAKNTANTRIFTFGVGNDVNATMLDKVADQTRAVSTYVRPEEDIEAKVSGLYGKITHPVLANLKLSAGNGIQLSEIYPPELPDLFHGGQLVVLGRYTGKGPAALTLAGRAGKQTREFTYEVNFPEQTNSDRTFVEHLWARRKVGYLLDQIRANGDKKELVDEVVLLAKKYGITTPYTSYLIVAETPMVTASSGGGPGGYAPAPAALKPTTGAAPQKVADYARSVQTKPGELAAQRGKFEDEKLQNLPATAPAGDKDVHKALGEAKSKKEAYDRARDALARKQQAAVQAGKLGVDLSLQTNNLRNQSQLEQTACRNVSGRNCLEIGGVWIDEGYDAKMPTVTVKAQSEAYFRLLERHPQVKDVLQLGNHLVWVTPSGTALVIDTSDGKEKLSDAEIDQLFAAKK